jgi:hypothetical protein
MGCLPLQEQREQREQHEQHEQQEWNMICGSKGMLLLIH